MTRHQRKAAIQRLVELGYNTTAKAALSGPEALAERLPILRAWAGREAPHSARGGKGTVIRTAGDLEAYEIAVRLAS